jgi:hypothetical protein
MRYRRGFVKVIIAEGIQENPNKARKAAEDLKPKERGIRDIHKKTQTPISASIVPNTRENARRDPFWADPLPSLLGVRVEKSPRKLLKGSGAVRQS